MSAALAASMRQPEPFCQRALEFLMSRGDYPHDECPHASANL